MIKMSVYSPLYACPLTHALISASHWFWARFHLWCPSLHCICVRAVYLIIPLSSLAKGVGIGSRCSVLYWLHLIRKKMPHLYLTHKIKMKKYKLISVNSLVPPHKPSTYIYHTHTHTLVLSKIPPVVSVTALHLCKSSVPHHTLVISSKGCWHWVQV